MGWDYCDKWKTINDVKEAVKDSFNRSGISIVAEGKGKGCLWFSVEKNNQRTIEVALYQKEGGSFAYKLLSELEHPYYYDVPKSVFETILNHPSPNDYSSAWRAVVMKRLYR